MTFRVFSGKRPTKTSILPLVSIFLTVFFSFGLFTGKLGLYGSQWNSIFNPNDALRMDRLSQWITSGLIGIIGTDVILYHLINGVMFFVTALFVYHCLNQIGMDPPFSLAASLLFLVFPGFTQPGSAFSLTCILLGMIFSLLSVIFYQRAFEGQKSIFLFWGGLCVLIAASLSTETAIFVGLISFIFLALILKTSFLNKTNSFLIGLINLCAALFIALLITPAWNDVTSESLSGSLKILISGILLSWRRIIAFPSDGFSIIFYITGVGAASILLFFIFRTFAKNDGIKLVDDRKYIRIVVLSLAGAAGYLILLRLFSISTSIDYPFDGPMLVTGLFASLFILSLIKLLFQEKYHYFLMAMLIGFSGGARYQAVDRFARENARILNFLSQLQVRGDSFADGAAILVEQLPFEFTSRDAIESLSRHYLEDTTSKATSFNIVPAEDELVREFLGNDDKQVTRIQIGSKEVEVNKKNIMAVWLPTNGCLQILDSEGIYGELPLGLNLALTYTNPEVFHVKYMSDVLQLDRFRTTIEPDYCFSIELIQRFAANAQWKEVLDEYSKSYEKLSQNFDFNVVKPVLMAMIEEGEFDEAVHLTLEHSQNPDQKSSLCSIWKNTISLKYSDTEVVALTEKASQKAGCN